MSQPTYATSSPSGNAVVRSPGRPGRRGLDGLGRFLALGTAVEADAPDRRAGGPLGRHHRGGAAGPVSRPPIERAVADQVHEAHEHGRREEQDLDQPEGAEVPVDDGPGEQEDDLDVEHDEDHRHQVEPHREALGGLPRGEDAGLVRRALGGARTAGGQQPRHHQADRRERRGEDRQGDDGEILAHGTTPPLRLGLAVAPSGARQPRDRAREAWRTTARTSAPNPA